MKKEKFIRGSDRLAKMLIDPQIRAEVDAVVDEMEQDDRAYRIGLAAVRQAASLTQVELARRMGIKQSALSGLENRDDLLLSTLANYLDAVGARDVKITARIGDRAVEMPLPKVTRPAPPPAAKSPANSSSRWPSTPDPPAGS